ncbi:MAG: DUF819 family protein [Mangrovicoccus sp.]|nr:DUF819 family protein [Mangrovicoccus sp.]
MTVFMIAVLLLLPLLLILACQNMSALDRIGVVPLTFGIGFLIAGGLSLLGLQETQSIREIQTTIAEVAVALALPLIIFSTSLKTALKESRGALGGMLLAMGAVCLASFTMALVFSGQIANLWQVAGMAVGAYTGSGVNLGAVKTALNAPEDLFLTMVTYDIVFSALFMLVILTLGKSLAAKFLRPYVYSGAAASDEDAHMRHLAEESAQGYGILAQKQGLFGSLAAFLAAAAVVAAALAIASLAPENLSSTMTILAITGLAALASLIPALHKIRTSFHLGMYFILIFCLASATTLDFAIFTRIDWALGAYFITILLGAMVLLALICRWLDIDRDTYLIVAGASIMSVPFIPVIAGALKNREIVMPGIAVAIIGYVLGNYLGVLVAHAVKLSVGA